MGNEPVQGYHSTAIQTKAQQSKATQLKRPPKAPQNGHNKQQQEQQEQQQYAAATTRPPPNIESNGSESNIESNIQHYTHYNHHQNGHNYYGHHQNHHSHQNQYISHHLHSHSGSMISPSIIGSHNSKKVNKSNNKSNNKSLEFEDGHHFRLNTKMTMDDFSMLKCVGKGSFGHVWQVEMKKNGKIYALKILKKKDLVARKQVIHTNTERRILANIDHPFLVSLRYAFQTKSKLFMVMDFFNGGELFYHLQNEGKFTEKRARFYSAEICLAIECLHLNDITYRDLKPENILLDYDGHIKITDFGLSKESVSSDPNCITRTFCGSPEYLAPEQLQQNGYNQMVDWWAFGTILYEMICGLPPFYDKNIQKMYQNILYQQIPFYKFMSRESIDLISKLLNKSPIKRVKCKQIKLSKFFDGINWEKLYNKEIEPPFKPKVSSKSDASNFPQFQNNSSLKPTPSIKTESLLAAKDKFPNFTYDETTANNDILYVD